MNTSTFHWSCRHTWKRSAKNTAWCVLGCAIGDFGTILFFQLTQIPFPVLGIMILAIINGLITSIILETIILMTQNFNFVNAFKTACGMSLISMISMEIMISILIIEIKLIPQAVLNALTKLKFCVIKIIVSKIILVINPLMIAKIIIPKTGKGIWVNWKNNIVPKSPMAQPSTHQAVFFALLFQVCLQDQWNVEVFIIIWY